MRFGSAPLLLLLLALLPAGAALLWLACWRRHAVRRMVRSAALRVSRPRRLVKAALLLSGMAFLVLAAARPQRGEKTVLLPREGTDVIIVLDVSVSMLVEDVAPNRFERAKVVLGQVLSRLEGSRAGMVVFAGTATQRFPLTTDLTAARNLINNSAIKEGGLSAGTGIGGGLKLAVESFESGPNTPARGKAIIVVSDGEDFAGAPEAQARQAKDQGIVIHAIGVGRDEASPLVAPRVPGATPNPRAATPTGASRRDEGLLKALAAQGSGRYVDGNGDDAAPAIAAEIARLDRARFETQEGKIPIERYQPFAALALLLLAAELLLADSRRARSRGASASAAPSRRRDEQPRRRPPAA